MPRAKLLHTVAHVAEWQRQRIALHDDAATEELARRKRRVRAESIAPA
jgi:hypothetical protein